MLRQSISLNKGDVISIKNYSSSIGTITIQENAGGSANGVIACLILTKLSTKDVGKYKYVECESKDEKRKLCMFKQYLHRNRKIDTNGNNKYGCFLNNDPQVINAQQQMIMEINDLVNGIQHIQGTKEMIVEHTGIYNATFNLSTIAPAQFALAINGVVNPTTISGTNSGAALNSMIQLIVLKKGDVVTLIDNISAITPINTTNNAGGTAVGNNTIVTFYRITPCV